MEGFALVMCIGAVIWYELSHLELHQIWTEMDRRAIMTQ